MHSYTCFIYTYTHTHVHTRAHTHKLTSPPRVSQDLESPLEARVSGLAGEGSVKDPAPGLGRVQGFGGLGVLGVRVQG